MPEHLDGRRYVVLGPAGSGKTMTAQAIVAHLVERRRAVGPVRLVVFDPASGDPRGLWRPKGAVYVLDRLSYLRELTRLFGAAAAPPVVVKRVFRDWSPLEQLQDAIIVVDEAHRFADPTSIDPSFQVLLTEGRKQGLDVVVATQQPSHLHPDALANASAVYIHGFQHRAHRAAIERGLGIDLRDVRWKPIPGTDKATEPLCWPKDFEDDDGAGAPACKV